MSRRVTVTTGFAGLMVVLTLVGVGMGYATGSALDDPATPQATSTVPSSSGVSEPPTTTSTTSTVAGRLEGLRCQELHAIARRVATDPPSFFAFTSESDATLLTLVKLNPKTKSYYSTLAALGRVYVSVKPNNGVFIAPFTMSSDVETFLDDSVSNSVIYYQTTEEPRRPGRTSYPAVLLTLGPTNLEESAFGLERLMTNLITVGSKEAGCLP